MHTTLKNAARRPRLAVATTLAASALLGGAAYAASPGTSVAPASSHRTPEAHLRLQPSSPALEACFPHARARVDVHLTTDAVGKDAFTITARGLKARTDFTVFLIEKPGAPFGAAEYIGDFTTNRHGWATNTYRLIVEEAFAFDNETHARTDLNSVGVWFADPRDDDHCLGAASPVTGFDGDASAGVQMLNSGLHVLP
jgi:hypothetical protein